MSNHDQYDDLPVEAPRMSWFAWLFFAVIGAGGIGYFIQSNDYVGAASVLIVLLAAFSGFRLGFSKMGASLAAIAAAFWFAPKLGVQYESHFTEWFGSTGLMNRVISIGGIGIAIALIGTIVLSMVTGRILKRRPRLAWMNSWLGFATGAVQGAVAILLFLGGLLMVEPMELQRASQGGAPDAQPNKASELILKVTEHTHNSMLGPHIEEYNPFVKIPQLNKIEEIQKSVQVFSNPGKISEFLNHPNLQQLKQQPEVTKAVNSLISDPEISAVMNQGDAMNRDAAMRLLNHPALMELIDNEEFMERASQVIKETKLMSQLEI